MTLAGRLLQTSLTNFQLKKSVFHIPRKMLEANKVLMLARSSKKKLPNLHKRKQPDESLKERPW